MHNTSLCFPFPFPFPPSSSFAPSSSHGRNHQTLMPLLISFFFILHLVSFLLSKLFSFLLRRTISKREVEDQICISPSHFHENKLISIIGSEESKNTLLVKQVSADSKPLSFLPADSNPLRFLPAEDYSFSSAPQNVAFDAIDDDDDDADEAEDETLNEEKRGVQAGIENHEAAKKDFTADPKLDAESTSKSSIEWPSSTIIRDSETEYPFSSSSRRSFSNWEFYSLFKKYDEEMLFFDRISAQKLAETAAESFRSIKAQPKSISKRIAEKLVANSSRRARDPYQELECAYVAQICLAWEALNWDYHIYRRSKGSKLDVEEGSVCQAHVAQKFQQFQVLLQRFIENEPYEFGRRPEIFARFRLSSPKLLQVPEFIDFGDNHQQEVESKISSVEFLSILEEAVQTFMNFLKADKRSPCERLKALVKRKQSPVDPAYLRLLKKVNKKKKQRLEEIGRRWKYPRRRRRLKEDEEMEILMATIDMKVVSRVLKMRRITEEQLHWCEDKMSKVRVWEGKMQRDHSPLFFPVH